MRRSKAINICKHQTHPVVVFGLMWIVIFADSLSIVLRIICIQIWIIETDIKFCVFQILIFCVCVCVCVCDARTIMYSLVDPETASPFRISSNVFFKISDSSPCVTEKFDPYILLLYGVRILKQQGSCRNWWAG